MTVAVTFTVVHRIARKSVEPVADVQVALADLVIRAGWSYDDVVAWALELPPGLSVVHAVEQIIEQQGVIPWNSQM